MKHNELKRMSRRYAVLAQQLRDLNRADDTNVAVEIAALRNGVDVRAGHDHGQRWIRAGSATDDVASRVDAHVEPGLAHQRLDVLAAGEVCLAERHAADAARRIGAETPECLKALLEPLRGRP